MGMCSIYVILTTHSSHLYLMWDFTHTCNPTIDIKYNYIYKVFLKKKVTKTFFFFNYQKKKKKVRNMTRTSNGHNFHSIYINQQFSNALFSNNENPIEQSPKLLKNARRKTNCPMKPPTHSPSELQMRAIRPTTTHKARVKKSGPFSFQSYTRGFVPLRYMAPFVLLIFCFISCIKKVKYY